MWCQVNWEGKGSQFHLKWTTTESVSGDAVTIVRQYAVCCCLSWNNCSCNSKFLAWQNIWRSWRKSIIILSCWIRKAEVKYIRGAVRIPYCFSDHPSDPCLALSVQSVLAENVVQCKVLIDQLICCDICLT